MAQKVAAVYCVAKLTIRNALVALGRRYLKKSKASESIPMQVVTSSVNHARLLKALGGVLKLWPIL